MWKLRQVINNEEQRQKDRIENVLARFVEHKDDLPDTHPVVEFLDSDEVTLVESESSSTAYYRLGCLGK